MDDLDKELDELCVTVWTVGVGSKGWLGVWLHFDCWTMKDGWVSISVVAEGLLVLLLVVLGVRS